eukprot:NODE_138_length_16264_cov_1.140860.p2 type:complete len:631 gc:universal NODE_138_length_16264_cov_1.140860:6499-8391(+)
MPVHGSDLYSDVFSIIRELKLMSMNDDRPTKNVSVGTDTLSFKTEQTLVGDSLDRERRLPVILSLSKLRSSPRQSLENLNEKRLDSVKQNFGLPEQRETISSKQETLIKKLDSMIMENPIKIKEDIVIDPKVEALMKDLEKSPNLPRKSDLKKGISFEDVKSLSLKRISGPKAPAEKNPLKLLIQQEQQEQRKIAGEKSMIRSDTLVVDNPTLQTLTPSQKSPKPDSSQKIPLKLDIDSSALETRGNSSSPPSPISKTPKLTELMIQQIEEQKNLSNHRRMTDFKGPQYPWNQLNDLEPQTFTGEVDKYMKFISQYISEPQFCDKRADLDTKKTGQGYWFLLNICKFPSEAFSIRLLTIKDVDPEIKRYLLKDNAVYSAFNMILSKLGPHLKNRDKWTWISNAIPVQPNRGADIDIILSDPIPFVVASKELKTDDMNNLYRLLDFNGTSFSLISYLSLDQSIFEASNQYNPLLNDFIEANCYHWMNKAWQPIIKLKSEKWIDTFSEDIHKLAIPFIIQRFFRMTYSRYGLDVLKSLIFKYCVIPAFQSGKVTVPELTESSKKKFQQGVERLIKSNTTSAYIPKVSDKTFQFKGVSIEVANVLKNHNFIRYSRLVETSLVIELLSLQHMYS